MSVLRSPPETQSDLKDLQVLQPLQNNNAHYNSDSALNTTNNSTLDENYFNITKRLKRNIGELPSSSNSEIKCMIEDMMAKQDKNLECMMAKQDNKLELLNDAILTIVAQNIEIQKSVQSMSSQQEKLLAKVNTLEQQNEEYKKQISDMERKIDMLERNNYSSILEIRNVKKQKDENKDVLLNIVQNVCSSIGLEKTIKEDEIKNVYRPKSDTIIAEFSTCKRQEMIISQYKKYNKEKRERKEAPLNSENISLPGPRSTIYLSECLTSKSRRLFFIARENVKNKKLAASWTSYGRVYVKKEEGSSPIRVNEESELLQLTS